jgi:hypothetical protein
MNPSIQMVEMVYTAVKELGVVQKLDPKTGIFVDKKSGGSPAGDRQATANKKNKLSTIQQKLDRLPDCQTPLHSDLQQE